MELPKEISDLIERFERNRESYLSGQYNETQLRREFLDPFFCALGWDVDNKQGYAEAYKDVIHEDALKIGGATKAPDYCFRVGGVKKFFVEAKKPSINLKEDVSPAFQLRRYAWSAKLPLSILTDFEEFAVYDCRIKPAQTDKASTGRVLYLTYKDYQARWDELVAIFSREALLKGSFDKYSESSKLKKGTATVDNAFLSEIEDWRDMLARNIALRNADLSQRELNFAVQRTIDRIVFLRICEDRGIEEYGRLQMQLNGTNIYRRLVQLFTQADDRYNSGLFHFQREKDRHEEPDNLTLNITIDDKPLKDIIKRLYYPESPYEFSVLSADILGQVYEQLLGKVIRLTSGHQAKVEEKPELRKAGGVYYTPTYIVDYIVKNTVGKLVEGKKPKEIERLKILDPACGSGSFLLGAYQYLLDWHLKWYIENDPEKCAKAKHPPIYQGPSPDPRTPNWHLTTTEKKRILLNNIYGVDIDSQAVEVTKLSLLLKVLEGENDQTLKAELRLFHQRALPDLGDNIKCGNSLIGPDFYQQQNLLDDEERLRINVFDWEKEFSEIMKAGGFDAVIGNPPYVRQETLGEEFKTYAKQKFSTFAGTADLYVYFIEKSHCLLRKDGLYGMICANKFMRSNYGKPLRDFLATKTTLIKIVDFGELPVFQNAATFPAVYLTQNRPSKEQAFTYAPIKRLDFETLTKEVDLVGANLDSKSISGDSWTLANQEEMSIIEKMNQIGVPLSHYSNVMILRGVLTGLTEAFVIDEATKNKLIAEDKKASEFIKPFAVGDDVRKYIINSRGRYLILIPKGWTNQHIDKAHTPWEWFSNNYPSLAKHLEPFALKAAKRADKGDYWWELRACDYYGKFEKPKIVYPDIAKESRIAFDTSGLYFANTIYFIPTDDLYLLALLNSKLMFSYYRRIAAVLGDADKGGRLRWFRQDVLKLPIRPINKSDHNDKIKHDKIVSLVNQMLTLNKRLPEIKTAHETTALQRQIVATDRQIDQLVYELYGLTEEEIKIVEGR
ncbi:MAG: Eco57I restriction-modification methylase domain-containing protein [Nitrospirae bacterium]|nr:Eco57I restriction-modification methylase domain-containing protein [Nitrospirota bacterium]